ncbi:MAG: hypothetical protein F6J87_13735 [Spirulina sp. SIO3F2]|nr:hypothetical protein [Spirulina sp. SIO3F2]
MLSDLIPFRITIDTVFLAGTALWALALYLSLADLRDWVERQLNCWFSFAERFMYFSEEEYEQTREAREAQNAFYAATLSVLPFLILGVFCNWGLTWSLGRSWAVSVGIMACVVCGLYELGRRIESEDS